MSKVEFHSLREKFEAPARPLEENRAQNLDERWQRLGALSSEIHSLYYMPDFFSPNDSPTFDHKKSPSLIRYYVMPLELVVLCIENISVDTIPLEWRIVLTSFDMKAPGEFLDLNFRGFNRYHRSFSDYHREYRDDYDIRYDPTHNLNQLLLPQIDLLSQKLGSLLGGKRYDILAIPRDLYEEYIGIARRIELTP